MEFFSSFPKLLPYKMSIVTRSIVELSYYRSLHFLGIKQSFMAGYTWLAIIFKRSLTFIVRFTSAVAATATHVDISQSAIAPPLDCYIYDLWYLNRTTVCRENNILWHGHRRDAKGRWFIGPYHGVSFPLLHLPVRILADPLDT